MRSDVLTLLAAAAGCLVVPASAQQTAPPTFVDRVEVRVIDVDVVVLDREGHSVRGLGRDDFELLEDGRPVEISNFLAYEEGESVGAPFGSAPVVGAPEAPEGRSAVAAPPPLTWVVYLDQAGVDPGPRSDLLKQLDRFLGASVRRGDRQLVASFDGASLKLLSPLSDDLSATRAALDRLRRQRGFASRLDGQRATLRREILQVDPGARGAGDEALRLLADIDRLADQEVLQTRAAVTAARDLLAILQGVEGRVAVLWAGAGLDSQPGDSLYRLWESKFGDSFGRNLSERQLDSTRTDLARELPRLLASANSGRFTLFTIQAGARGGPGLSADDPGSTEGISMGAADTTGLRESSALAALAAATGGRTFVAAPGLDRRLESARSDLVTYYSLGYHPTGDEPGRQRKLEVRIRQAGLRALHRAEVTDRSWEEQAAAATVSALVGDAEPANPFGISLVVGPGPAKERKRGNASLPLEVRVPLAHLTLLPGGERHQGQLHFEFALEDPDGGFRRLESRDLDFDVPDDQLPGALAQHVAFRVELALAPGRHRLAVTVLDRISGVRSTMAVPLDAGRS